MKMNLKRKNRSKHEIVADILKAIDADGTTIYEIQFKAYISYQHLKKYLTYLVQNGLIMYNKEEKRFRMTQLGDKALSTYAKMDELLIQRTVYTEKLDYFAPFP